MTFPFDLAGLPDRDDFPRHRDGFPGSHDDFP
jgi:hypothetical protein